MSIKRNIPFSPPDMSEAEILEVADALRSGWITTGPKTKEFENLISLCCQTARNDKDGKPLPTTVCLNSATACMELALRVLGIGEGDEVIVPAYTYTATASSVCHVGAHPVLVDCAPGSFEMDYDKLVNAITERTKAVMPVDLAGNVQILGMFALVQSIITKNVNILKVAAKDGGVFSRLLSAFESLEYTTDKGYTLKGNDLLETLAVVYFPRQAIALGELMSKNANVRIAWGGKEAVETVYNYPAMIDCETVIFGPKISFAVIAKESLNTEQEAKKLARKLTVDISVFDQTGCASPHNLFIEKGGEISPERFCEIMSDVFPKTEIQIPKPPVSTEQISEIHSIRGVYDFKGKSWGSPNMSWTILMGEQNELNKPVYSRVIFVHPVDDIEDSLVHIEDYVQTVGISAPLERAISYADKATAKGVARCPMIGRMLNFEMPWDGVFLIDRLVRWNTLLGPLT